MEEGDAVVALEVDTDVELRVQRRSIGEIITKSSDLQDDVASDGDGDGDGDDD